MGNLVKTWCINGGGEVITALCHRTLRTSERTKQMHRYQMHTCTTNAIQIHPIFISFLQEVNTGSNYFIQRNKVLSITNYTHSSQLFKQFLPIRNSPSILITSRNQLPGNIIKCPKPEQPSRGFSSFAPTTFCIL